MTEAINPATWVAWGGFLLAFIFGAVANKTNFCMVGAISEVFSMAHWGRARMWLLAIVIAMIGTHLLYYFDQIDLSRSLYYRPTLPWLSLLLGGFLFGVGMTIASGCANKNLVRLGAGSVRSLVVLVFMAISAYMTLKGLFAQWRVHYLDPVSFDVSNLGLTSLALPEMLAKISGLPEKTALLTTVSMLSLALLAFIFKDKPFRHHVSDIIGATVLGLLIVAGWYLTGHIGFGENPETLEIVYFATNTRTLESFSFVAPTAFSLEMLMLWTDQSLRVTFGMTAVAGIVLGSFAYAISTRQFRWEGFASVDDLRVHLTGAVLMGFGGVTAMGCTVGHGLSGIATLALGSMMALTSIICGAVAAMKWRCWRA